MSPTLTLFFIVEPPRYQNMACYLAASIRQCLSSEVRLVGYCPEHRIGEVDKDVVETLRRMRCDVRPFRTEGMFDPAYPHGNKILASLEPRDTEFSGFMDSDILMLRKNRISNLVREGHVSASVAASMYWAPQTVWEPIYGAFGMNVPDERVTLMRDQRKPMIPYYSSGFVLFPEQHRNGDGKRFPEVWLETAQTIDAIPDLENKRPYLDQMSLPIAIQRAGLKWRELPEAQHYILGGVLRGEPLPEDRKIYTVHYRKWEVLTEAGLAQIGYDALRATVGTRRISWIGKQPLPEGIEPAAPQSDLEAEPAAKERVQPAPAVKPGPDPSKADVAAVTMLYRDHFFLERWVAHWERQIGRENLYILRHGEDPEIDRIAKGANVIHMPREDDNSRFDRRRWGALSSFASGLTLYYNWVICNDVDELVVLDPDAGGNIRDYLNSKFANGRPPPALSPFAVEMVHTPASEPDPIRADAPILSVRRNFRLNSNYAKPCIIRGRTNFSIGGHGSNLQNVALDPSLYLFHLRFVDVEISTLRLNSRKSLNESRLGAMDETGRAKNSWDTGTESFDLLSRLEPVAETMDFPDFRKAMVEGRSQAPSTGNWFFKNMRSKDLYRLPDRFTTLF
ncbi:MAG: glycosyltransferase family 2 protein [Rhodobacteraceae bacterium]|nr:glycosyltransferase family 2 protein [Paracoccaceae bacterium]